MAVYWSVIALGILSCVEHLQNWVVKQKWLSDKDNSKTDEDVDNDDDDNAV